MHGKSVIGLGRTLAILMCTILGVVLFSSITKAELRNSETGATASTHSNCIGYYYSYNFTATSTYFLKHVDIEFQTLGSPTTTTNILYLKSVNGSTHKPTGSPLVTSNALTNTTTPMAWKSFTFPTYYEIQNGTEYALLFTTTEGSTYNSTTGCGGGMRSQMRIGQESGTNKVFYSNDNGSTWTDTGDIGNYKIYDDTSNTTGLQNPTIDQPMTDDRLPNYTQPSFVGTCTSAHGNLTLTVTPVYCFWGGGAACEAAHSQDPIDYVISPISCIGNVWTYSNLLLAGYTGRVNAHIIDGYGLQSNQVGFYLVDTTGWPGSAGNYDWYHQGSGVSATSTCASLVNWKCDLPLVGDFCAAGATVVNESACYIGNTIRNYEGAVTSTYPFAYGFQIMNALYSEADYATTSSSTIPTFVLNLGHGSTTIFDLNGSPPGSFTSITNAMYPWMVLLIHIGFVIYLVSLIL